MKASLRDVSLLWCQARWLGSVMSVCASCCMLLMRVLAGIMAALRRSYLPERLLQVLVLTWKKRRRIAARTRAWWTASWLLLVELLLLSLLVLRVDLVMGYVDPVASRVSKAAVLWGDRVHMQRLAERLLRRMVFGSELDRKRRLRRKCVRFLCRRHPDMEFIHKDGSRASSSKFHFRGCISRTVSWLVRMASRISLARPWFITFSNRWIP